MKNRYELFLNNITSSSKKVWSSHVPLLIPSDIGFLWSIPISIFRFLTNTFGSFYTNTSTNYQKKVILSQAKNPHTHGWIAESARHSEFSFILQHHHCFQMFKSGHKYFRLLSFSKQFSFLPCSRLFSTHFGFQAAENWVPFYESFLVSL